MRNKILLGIIAAAAIVIGCKKIREGFLSDTIRYKDRVLYAKRGMALTMSDAINSDGSTPPIHFELQNLRNKQTGEPAPAAFFTEYEVLVFKEGEVFIAEQDTTVELLNKKRELKKITPMVFNEVSGQLVFNRASANLPLGEYTFDLEARNVWGSKSYPDFADIHVVEPSTSDVFELTYTAATGSNTSEVFTGIKAPVVTAKKISNEGARVILKYVDKNGRAFDPSKGQIIKRGDRPFFETHAKFNPVIYSDTAVICDFEVAPFPLQKYIAGGTDWGYLLYYRIPRQFINIDGLPDNNANPVVAFQIKMEGTYVVEVKLTDATRID
ncbi:DUF5007 domain-containing protein [Parasegetibacter sp. NRK P23]|uniref:DUF5007 domain-containing protein n=1 Tax=Parasegetibacter sp. NRK P23 TaxID=2942999 RepID=UPI002042F829|nr:DUF5007 domain-containing protein [Parasegetibacter sp. NRK P23]MCM5530594.1 DUF5007 domain-containing protein [Parasegetibacter sp. NRK P23]